MRELRGRGASTRRRRRASLSMTLLLLLSFAGAGCQKKQQPKNEAKAEGAIVSSSTTPGTQFRTKLALDPAQPKDGKAETFILSVTDLNGRPVTNAKITGALIMPIMDMGKNEFPMKEQDAGVYRGAGTATMDGEWEVQFTIAVGELQAKHGYHVMFSE